jgi:hypothetical protein
MAEWWSAWWGEWSSYRPSDFLMFAPRIYWRMFESMHEAFWPLHLVLAVAALLAVWRGERAWRLSGVVLACCFVLAAYAHLHARFAPIFWVAEGYAVAFFVHACVVIVVSVFGRLGFSRSDVVKERDVPTPTRARCRASTALALWAVLAHPLLALAFQRPWTQGEWPGLAADPTAVLALAWALRVPRGQGARGVWMRSVWVVPIGWCLVSAATLATMGEWQAIVMLAAPVSACIAARAR